MVSTWSRSFFAEAGKHELERMAVDEDGHLGAVISVITIEEIAFGIACAPKPRRAKLGHWFQELLQTIANVYDVSPAIARAAGELRGVRANAGRTVAQADLLIAATAIVHGLTLATRNVSHFEDCGVVLVNPFS